MKIQQDKTTGTWWVKSPGEKDKAFTLEMLAIGYVRRYGNEK